MMSINLSSVFCIFSVVFLRNILTSIIIVASLSVSSLWAVQPYPGDPERIYPKDVFWGDTHLHTNLSVDAFAMGNQILSLDDAYNFAKGHAVIGHNGMYARLSRPLDFLVIADHAVNMGVLPELAAGNEELINSDFGKKWYPKFINSNFNTVEGMRDSSGESIKGALKSVMSGEGSFVWASWYFDLGEKEKAEVYEDKSFRQSIWQGVIESADHHNTPGVFTAFTGYEWTATAPAGVHRVVIFKDGADQTSQVLPFSYYDSVDPEDLWAYFEDYKKQTGGDVLAIPHNGNLTNGVMYAEKKFDLSPIDINYAERRSRWEPLSEVTQNKGDSETHPILSPNDTFADFETWNSWAGWSLDGVDMEGWREKKQHEYARSALAVGLRVKADVAVNPFKFGMIGSTDSHTSLATADDNNYWGKLSLLEPSPFRSNQEFYESKQQGRWEYAASGYAAIWAEENTRESLFAAMKRKEVYASTGPRINVRFFGGWDFQKEEAFRPDLAQIGYQKGVPMGGDLAGAPKTKAPNFLIRAVKDPDGANLDRVQVIKGWRDVSGGLHEKIYNVALSDGRKDLGPNTKNVGNTVNVSDASYTNTIGNPELAIVWEDPDFNPNELAFYYLRVLEIPTPRWSAYDAKYFKLKDVPNEIPLITQERAYTSPIWYTP